MPACKQCQTPFETQEKDWAFYKSMDLPGLVWCPQCTLIRTFAWRNQRILYHRTCDATGRAIISIFAPDSGYVVYDRDHWWSDKWDPLQYGRDVDFNRPFFEQFDELMHKVPQVSIFNAFSENSAYCNFAERIKNCYLLFASYKDEDVLYGENIVESKDSVDCLELHESEVCYETISSNKCFGVQYCESCEGCVDSWFLYDCKNCSNCIGCTNLRSKSYCIFNVQYSQAEYEQKRTELALHTREGIRRFQEQFSELKQKAIHRFANLINCEDSTGDNLVHVKRSHDCFAMREAQDCGYVTNTAAHMNDVYYGYGVGDHFERAYRVFGSGAQSNNVICSGGVFGVQYGYYLYNCSAGFELFGCTGLRNKQYCILNKQYSKEEYLKLKEKLVAHMKETGEWGEFPPPSMSPFGFNESLAADYANYSEEEALKLGFKWRDNLPFTTGKETASLDVLKESIAEAPESITNEIFACANCSKNYKVVKQEYAFYKRKNVPAPHFCPTCRFERRRTLRNPHQLWSRRCMCDYQIFQNTVKHTHHASGQCPNEFETVFSPDRKEIVYCKACYQAEVV